MQNCDIGVVSDDQRVIERLSQVSEEFSFQQKSWADLDEFMDDPVQCKVYIFASFKNPATSPAEESQNLLEAIQVLRQTGGSESFLIAVTEKMLPKDSVDFLRKSGLNYAIQFSELQETSKMEFLTTQMIRAQYIPIKDIDLIPGEEIHFDLYHLMPLKQKFLKIARVGAELSEEKIKKLSSVSEFYVHRNELGAFKKYVKNSDLTSREGQLRLCRAQFLEFYASYTHLVSLVTDQSETLSFEEGKKLMEGCMGLVTELADALVRLNVDDVWDVVNSSSIGDFGSLERTTAIAAYVAFFSIRLKYDQLENLILSCLMAQIGIISLSPKITQKIRHDQFDQLTAEELEDYQKYPLKSLDIVLSRRLQIDQEVKDIILLCNERADGKGFPNQAPSHRMNHLSQLLGFCYYFDQSTILRMGEQRKDQETVLKESIQNEIKSANRFTMTFLNEMKKTFEVRLQ